VILVFENTFIKSKPKVQSPKPNMQEEIIIRPKSTFSFGWNELWMYRELIYFFTWKEIKIRYKQVFLGFTWTLLQPIAMMAIFILLMQKGLGISTGNIPGPLYYLSGLLIWNLFNQGVTHASQSMVSHGNIIKKIYFPRLIIPISAIFTASFDFLISVAVFFCILLYYNLVLGQSIYIIPLVLSFFIAFLIIAFTAFSVGTLLSAINVKYRDVRYVLPFLIQSIFFITPVMYDVSVLRQTWLVQLLQLNPLNFSIQLVRETIHNNDLSYIGTFPWIIGIVLIALYIIGIYVFRKTESYFADIV